MLLEFRVWGSREWYDTAIPMLEDVGLKERPDLAWADPETDGELMGMYYDYDEKEGIDASQLADVLARVRAVVVAGEAPSIEIRFVAARKS